MFERAVKAGGLIGRTRIRGPAILTTLLLVAVLFAFSPPARAQSHVVDGVEIVLASRPDVPTVGETVVLTFSVRNASSGELVVHTDWAFEIGGTRGAILATGNLHTHEGTGSIDVTFSTAGQATVSVTVVTTPDTLAVAPANAFGSRSAQFTLTVTGVGPTTVTAEGVTFEFAPVPPQPAVGEVFAIRFNVKDEASGQLITHTDAAVTVSRKGSTVFRSSQVHSHSGEFEIAILVDEPGTYAIEIDVRTIEPSNFKFGEREVSFSLAVVGGATGFDPSLVVGFTALGLGVQATILGAIAWRRARSPAVAAPTRGERVQGGQ